jgi:hypothetical protein
MAEIPKGFADSKKVHEFSFSGPRQNYIWRKTKNIILAVFWFLCTRGKARLALITDTTLTIPYGVFLAAGAIYVMTRCY